MVVVVNSCSSAGDDYDVVVVVVVDGEKNGGGWGGSNGGWGGKEAVVVNEMIMAVDDLDICFPSHEFPLTVLLFFFLHDDIPPVVASHKLSIFGKTSTRSLTQR